MGHDGVNQDGANPGSGMPRAVAAKIVDREGLMRARRRLRDEGRTLVQCHGCFDIVHPGHIRHLRQARALGGALLVSITGDPEIRKGLGRPLIPEELRAENLAALDCVDLVYIDDGATAADLLGAVRPDVYVKGKEYENNADPRFRAEREIVESGGGRVVFSSGDVVFSSTALIAALEQHSDPYHQRLVQLSTSPALSGPELFRLVSAFKGRRVVVVGEVILDTYILCDRPDIAGESPVMTLRPLEARHYDGGAAIIARHAAALGARPILVTALPESPDGKALRARLENDGIEVRAIPSDTPVPEKQRFLVGSQKIMKVDLVEPFVLDEGRHEALRRIAHEAAAESTPGDPLDLGVGRSAGQCDAAIVADFGLGLFSPRSLADLTRELRPVSRILAGDVSGRRSNLRSMVGMDLVCPSESELRDALHLHTEGLPLVTWRLFEETGSKAALVTLGADGLLAFERLPDVTPDTGEWKQRLASEHVPALVPIALDPLGCGDALLATATLALGSGGTMLQAAFLGACAAGVQVQRLGNVAITPADLRNAIARIHTAHLTYAGPDAARAASASHLKLSRTG
ncbi:D-beta-D-heptose 7-phosphate kinase / D-beta-D-heptose 1-phosphate adenosyltransferase [Phycisphaerales bacterium]|nr:D-beta-D-heptose 7-phosphate kinase / D-beta-D-heptose 1-phosphate adenosyltransferase [Phycisphaerales bacterium]